MIASLYAGAATLASPLLRLMLRRRLARGRELAGRLPERWGQDATPRPTGRLVWLHAASVGETASLLPVLAELVRLAPDIAVVLTTGTVTSAAMLTRRLPELRLDHRVLHRFMPLDVPAWVARFLDHWRPDAAGFVESEIWPNLLAACAKRHIPAVLINARLSARSAARWRRAGGFARRQFGAFARVLAQSEGDARRLAALGARNVSAPGNLKFAAMPLPFDGPELQRLQQRLHGRPAWLAASTHSGEDALVFAAHAALARRFPGLLTIVAPRHAERGADIAALAGGWAGGWPVTRRALGGDPPDSAGIWVADTMGELGLLFRLAPIVLIGGSLVAHGGQNPLEAARLGCAVAIGPHSQNFAEIVATLRAAGALAEVADAAALADWVAGMLADPQRRAGMGEAGRSASRRDADLPRQVAMALMEQAAHAPA